MRLLELTNDRIADTMQKHIEKNEVPQIRKLLTSLPKISQRIDEMRSRRSVIEKLQNLNEETVEADVILNKWSHEESGKSLLFLAIDSKNLETIKLLLQSGAKPNVTHTKDEINAVTYACKVNADSKVVDQLMLHGGNPNIIGTLDSSEGKTSLYYLALHENVEGMAVLLHETWKYPFDWKKYINLYDGEGYTIFLMCCKNNLTKSIEHLFRVSNKRKIKMDLYLKTQVEDKESWFNGKQDDKTGLLIACSDNNTPLIKFLIREIYKKAEGLGTKTAIDESDEPYIGDTNSAVDDDTESRNTKEKDEFKDIELKSDALEITYDAPKSMDRFIGMMLIFIFIFILVYRCVAGGVLSFEKKNIENTMTVLCYFFLPVVLTMFFH